MKFLLFLFFLLITGLGGFYYWWSQPAQVVNRNTDALLELVSHQKLNLQTKEKMAATLNETAAPTIIIQASENLPTGSFSQSDIIGYIETFHAFVFSLEIEEISRNTTFQDGEAWMRLKANAKLNQGRSNARTETFEAYLVFAKSAEWKLVRAEIIEK